MRRSARSRFGPRSWRTVLGALAAAVLFALPWGAARSQTSAAHDAGKIDRLPEASAKTYGSKSAPIRVEAFTDYQCPGCRALFEQAFKPMIQDYVASGKVYLIHHDFPLARHPYSGQAARWANAAAEVGDFPAVESALYDNQDSWAESGQIAAIVSRAVPAADFRRIEAILKPCTMPALQVAGAGKEFAASDCGIDLLIAQDIKLGNELPVAGTPTYTVYYRGQTISTSSSIVSWPTMKQFFDALLRQ